MILFFFHKNLKFHTLFRDDVKKEEFFFFGMKERRVMYNRDTHTS